MASNQDQIKFYGAGQGHSWIARPVTSQSMLGNVTRQGSVANYGAPIFDPLVTLIGSVHERFSEAGSMKGSTFFPHFGSMFSIGGNQTRNEEWDVESVTREGEDYQSEGGVAEDSDDNLQSPLISRQATNVDWDLVPHGHGNILSMRQGNLAYGTDEPFGGMGIGGGWQLAWKWEDKEGLNGQKEMFNPRTNISNRSSFIIG